MLFSFVKNQCVQGSWDVLNLPLDWNNGRSVRNLKLHNFPFFQDWFDTRDSFWKYRPFCLTFPLPMIWTQLFHLPNWPEELKQNPEICLLYSWKKETAIFECDLWKQLLCLLRIMIDFPHQHRWEPIAQELRLMGHHNATTFLKRACSWASQVLIKWLLLPCP